MANPIVAFVSDLHLGKGDNLDDFMVGSRSRGPDFERFCGKLVEMTDSRTDSLTLVLNGDIIDFWEICDEDELVGDQAVASIEESILHPLERDQNAVARATSYRIQQVEDALNAHPGFVAGLQQLLGVNNSQLVYLFGNHDHAMVNPEVQARFRRLVGASHDQLNFAHYFESPELNLYAEHGNQFAREDSYCVDPEDWKAEPLGYYAIKYIWNRYQFEFGSSHPTVAEGLGFLVSLVTRRSNDPKKAKVLQYMIDYFLGEQKGRVPKIVGGYGLGWVKTQWHRAGSPPDANDFFIQTVTDAADERLETTEGIRRLDSRSRRLKDLPGEVISPEPRFDRYTSGLVGRFKRRVPPPFKSLNRNRHLKLVMGHTHQPRNQFLHQDGFSRQRYMNVGAWTRDVPHPTFGYIDNPRWTEPPVLFRLV